MSECALLYEGRKVISVWNFDGQIGAKVGLEGVTSINVVGVAASMAYTPWFEVWRGPLLWKKLNAAHAFTVEYAL